MPTRYRGSRFVRTDYRECSDALGNPGCGWYHVYTFRAQPPADGRTAAEEIWLDEACQAEQLALVLIDIGSFRTDSISDEALLHIEQIMELFRRNHMQVILRCAYDIEGREVPKEPSDLALIRRHMEQIGDVIVRFADNILVIQGILVGRWGEMHGSAFLDEDSVCELVNTLYRVTRGKCYLAVRTPSQWRRIVGNPRTEQDVAKRLALFNDGIFGSPTDLGTYGVTDRKTAGEMERWLPGEELEWQERYIECVPNGGEVLLGDRITGCERAVSKMRRMHLTYLNSIYQQEQLDAWKSETMKGCGCFDGMSGYDYIGRHLGYRFVIRDVRLKRGWQLEIHVENCGFARLYEEADCILTVESEGRLLDSTHLNEDARNWKSGKISCFQVKVDSSWRKIQRESLQIFLQLKRKSDGRILRFANQGAEKQVLLGEIRNYAK